MGIVRAVDNPHIKFGGDVETWMQARIDDPGHYAIVNREAWMHKDALRSGARLGAKVFAATGQIIFDTGATFHLFTPEGWDRWRGMRFLSAIVPPDFDRRWPESLYMLHLSTRGPR